MPRPYNCYLSWFKTDKQKIAHVSRYWSKENLLCLLSNYLIPDNDMSKNDPEDIAIWEDCLKLKTKKAILNKYIDIIWEFVWEEYSAC